jgi:hypothetical protein
VLFATGVDKIRACKLSGGSILGRVIKIQPAPSGNYRRMRQVYSMRVTSILID